MRSKLQIASNIKVELDLKKNKLKKKINFVSREIFFYFLNPERCVTLKIHSMAKRLRCLGSAVSIERNSFQIVSLRSKHFD